MKVLGKLATVAAISMAVVLPGAAALAATQADQPPTPQLSAADPGSSGYFEYQLAAGQQRSGSVTVHNPGTAAATFNLYATDATTSTATGVVYGGMGAPVTATGTWVHLGATTMTLAAGASQQVPFTVTVPAGAGPGDHVAGIAAQNPVSTNQHLDGGRKDVGVALDVSTRVVVAVVVHVPGPAAAGLTFGPPDLHAENGNRQVIGLPISVSGQLLIKPSLEMDVRSCAGGAALAHLTRQLDTLVPATSIVYQWPLGTLVLPAGCYTVSAHAAIGATPLADRTGNVTVTAADATVKPLDAAAPARGPRRPASHAIAWPLVAALAAVPLVVAGLVVALLRSRRRRRALEAQLAQWSEVIDPVFAGAPGPARDKVPSGR